MTVCMKLQMEIWKQSQAVNSDIPMNRSSGAPVTLYNSPNHDRAAAKTTYPMQGGLGGDRDEVWREETSRKT